MRRRGSIRLAACIAGAITMIASSIMTLAVGQAGLPPKRPMSMSTTRLVLFEASPFPFGGLVPGDGEHPATPFIQVGPDGRRFHLSPRGGVLYEDATYSDRRSLLVIPPRFDPRAPGAAIVLFFHGNLATLDTVVGRQGVPDQLLASRLDAVMVAPQLAVQALDSSPGRFYEPDFFVTYMHEAAVHLAAGSNGRFTAHDIDALPVVIVAYSGGYLATAFCLREAGMRANSRIKGVVLLDALFGETQKFVDWIAARTDNAFFVSAYSASSAPLNRQLEDELRAQGLMPSPTLPSTIQPGTVAFLPALGSRHEDFVTQAWTRDPLEDLLRRISLSP